MIHKSVLPSVILLTLFLLPAAAAAQTQQSCFTAEARAQAERSAKVWRQPESGYDPVLGFNSGAGLRKGSPPVDSHGIARPINCVANKDLTPGAGTTPKFHCSVPGKCRR